MTQLCLKMHRTFSTLAGVGALFLLLMVAGCGGYSGDRVPVAGEVLLDGQPLDRGTIEFHPEESGLSMTGGMIQDGEFSIPAPQGAKPGKYSVRIFASTDPGDVDSDEPPGPEAEGFVAEERIPARYNTETELEATVGEGGATDLQFEVSSS